MKLADDEPEVTIGVRIEGHTYALRVSDSELRHLHNFGCYHGIQLVPLLEYAGRFRAAVAVALAINAQNTYDGLTA